jgi:glycerol-3-phosphate acyltransferase PlsX
MRIAVDAMGSDNHPAPDVAGAVMAAREYGLEIVLVGDQTLINPLLEQDDTADLPIEVVHTAEFISMTDHPVEAARTKKNSSMHVGTNLVKAGEAEAFVTAGNTGGLLAVATLHTLRRIPGVLRPALAVVFYMRGHYSLLADIGANVDCKPEWLRQFALMAVIYAERGLGVENPRVALLSNGEEDVKGNELTKTAAALIRRAGLNYVGHVEPKEVLLTDKADVVVQDGFVGNILTKTYGATAELMFTLLKEEAGKSLRTGLGLQIAKPGLRSVKHQIDPMEVGGAALLGVNGVVISAHGRSNALGIKSAIRQARDAVKGNVIEAVRAGIARWATLSEAVAV